MKLIQEIAELGGDAICLPSLFISTDAHLFQVMAVGFLGAKLGSKS